MVYYITLIQGSLVTGYKRGFKSRPEAELAVDKLKDEARRYAAGTDATYTDSVWDNVDPYMPVRFHVDWVRVP